ncbi:MAG: zinc-ribbon domain-containing protein [Clostridiales bacterium]|nr:zinc-ribbon domain-containing protein [Clostridiales bacterium]
MYCKNCGNQIDDNAYVCIHCGVRVSDEVPLVKQEHPRFCTHCGKQIDPNAYICVHCGVKTGANNERIVAKSTGKNSVVLAILGIVFAILSATLLSAVFSIIGMTIAINKSDKKAIKLNLVAIIVCVAMCLVTIVFAPMK